MKEEGNARVLRRVGKGIEEKIPWRGRNGMEVQTQLSVQAQRGEGEKQGREVGGEGAGRRLEDTKEAWEEEVAGEVENVGRWIGRGRAGRVDGEGGDKQWRRGLGAKRKGGGRAVRVVRLSPKWWWREV